MAFRFALQSVLRLRSSLAHQEEQRLFAFASLANRLRAEIANLEQSDLAKRRTAWEELETLSWGAQLRFRAHCDSAAASTLNNLRLQLKDAESKRAEQLKVYQDARRRREMLESLRERQEEIYRMELAHRQQQEADEAFLARQFLNSHG